MHSLSPAAGGPRQGSAPEHLQRCRQEAGLPTALLSEYGRLVSFLLNIPEGSDLEAAARLGGALGLRQPPRPAPATSLSLPVSCPAPGPVHLQSLFAPDPALTHSRSAWDMQTGHSLFRGQCCRAAWRAAITRSTFSRVALQPSSPIRSTWGWGRGADLSCPPGPLALTEFSAEPRAPPAWAPPHRVYTTSSNCTGSPQMQAEPYLSLMHCRASERGPGWQTVKATQNCLLSGHS